MLPHEIHNQAKDKIIDILESYSKETNMKVEDFLILMETTIASSLLLITTDPNKQLRILNILIEGVKERLVEIKNRN